MLLTQWKHMRIGESITTKKGVLTCIEDLGSELFFDPYNPYDWSKIPNKCCNCCFNEVCNKENSLSRRQWVGVEKEMDSNYTGGVKVLPVFFCAEERKDRKSVYYKLS